MGAFRLASKGHTMADSSYDSEVKSIQAFLSMQHPSSAPVLNPNDANFQPENYVAPRFFRKLKTSRQVVIDKHVIFINCVIVSFHKW